MRPQAPRAGFAGELRLQDASNGVLIADAVPAGSPAYAAGLERDDLIVSIGGTTAARASAVSDAIASTRPGSTLAVTYLRRSQRIDATLGVVADPRTEVVPAEQAGQALTDAQRRFRDAWLRSRAVP